MKYYLAARCPSFKKHETILIFTDIYILYLDHDSEHGDFIPYEECNISWHWEVPRRLEEWALTNYPLSVIQARAEPTGITINTIVIFNIRLNGPNDQIAS